MNVPPIDRSVPLPLPDSLEADAATAGLDPADWDGMRALGHRMVDDMMDYLRGVRDRPAWQPMPPETKAAFDVPLPAEGQPADEVYAEFVRHVLPYPSGNIHPRFWGWVMGTGTPLGMMADMLAAAMNSNTWGGEQSPAYVEAQVLEWFRQAMGFPAGTTGLLLSGGSMANLVGLTVARNAAAGPDVIRRGVRGLSGDPVIYASEQTHNSVDKAAVMLGLGTEGLRKVRTDAAFRIDVDALEAAIEDDLSAGRRPFAIVANAGTVGTGAIDPFHALADLAMRRGMWLHVDGAIAAPAMLSPALRPLLDGMERADSLAFDLHKWLYVPYEAGAVLVRDGGAQHRSFTPSAGAYLKHEERGPASGPHWFSEHGPQLSRGFRALKVWMSLKEHGTARYARAIEQNVAQARYLADLVVADPLLELGAPVPLNIVCFRARPQGVREDALNALNREVLLRIQERGIAVPSANTIAGIYLIRVAITNHRTRREDLHALVDAVREITAEVLAES